MYDQLNGFGGKVRTVAVPLYRTSNIVVLDTGQFIYEISEEGQKLLLLTVNDTVEFFRDKDNKIIILDIKNKKHKFVIFGAKRK